MGKRKGYSRTYSTPEDIEAARGRAGALLESGVSFERVERFLLFIGFPRSGHSLVGAILNGHPDALISHELDALRLVTRGFNRDQLFATILERDRQFERLGRKWNEYSYALPGEYSLPPGGPRVIGDKKGGKSAADLARRPELIERVRRLAGAPLTFLKVIRNPYDMISSRAIRRGDSVSEAIEDFFRRVAFNRTIERKLEGGELITLRLEDLTARPHQTLAALAESLGLCPDETWLDSGAELVRDPPSPSRRRVEWPPALRQQVAGRVAAEPTFAGYEF